MNLHGEINNSPLRADLSFSILHTGGDNKQAKTLLYQYMLSKGYPVTESMSILAMVKILVGGVSAKFTVILKTLIVEDATGAGVTASTLSLANGATVIDKLLKLEDV